MNWWPWISRAMALRAMSRLEEECSELKEERRTLLDRLAVIGFGGPLYSFNADQEPSQEDVAEAVTSDPDRELLDQLIRLRRRPAKLADQLTRQYRDARKRVQRPAAAWAPSYEGEVDADLNAAEALGKELGQSLKMR